MTVNSTPISKRLKEARVLAGLSQKKLGIAADIYEFSASVRMNQYEISKNKPDYLALKNIGKILNCPVSFFDAEDSLLAEAILTLPRSTKKELKFHSIIKENNFYRS